MLRELRTQVGAVVPEPVVVAGAGAVPVYDLHVAVAGGDPGEERVVDALALQRHAVVHKVDGPAVCRADQAFQHVVAGVGVGAQRVDHDFGVVSRGDVGGQKVAARVQLPVYGGVQLALGEPGGKGVGRVQRHGVADYNDARVAGARLRVNVEVAADGLLGHGLTVVGIGGLVAVAGVDVAKVHVGQALHGKLVAFVGGGGRVALLGAAVHRRKTPVSLLSARCRTHVSRGVVPALGACRVRRPHGANGKHARRGKRYCRADRSTRLVLAHPCAQVSTQCGNLLLERTVRQLRHAQDCRQLQNPAPPGHLRRAGRGVHEQQERVVPQVDAVGPAAQPAQGRCAEHAAEPATGRDGGRYHDCRDQGHDGKSAQVKGRVLPVEKDAPRREQRDGDKPRHVPGRTSAAGGGVRTCDANRPHARERRANQQLAGAGVRPVVGAGRVRRVEERRHGNRRGHRKRKADASSRQAAVHAARKKAEGRRPHHVELRENAQVPEVGQWRRLAGRGEVRYLAEDVPPVVEEEQRGQRVALHLAQERGRECRAEQGGAGDDLKHGRPQAVQTFAQV